MDAATQKIIRSLEERIITLERNSSGQNWQHARHSGQQAATSVGFCIIRTAAGSGTVLMITPVELRNSGDPGSGRYKDLGSAVVEAETWPNLTAAHYYPFRWSSGTITAATHIFPLFRLGARLIVMQHPRLPFLEIMDDLDITDGTPIRRGA